MHKIVKFFLIYVIVHETLANESEKNLQDDYSDYNANIYNKYVQMDKQLKGLAEQGVKSLLPILLEARENVNISASCSRNLFDLITGFRRLTNWSLNFLDAMGKPQSGILAGNLHMFGEYEECIGTMVKKRGKVDFQGKYCLAFLRPYLPKVRKIPGLHGRLEGLVNATRNSSDLMKQFVSRVHGFYAPVGIGVGLCVPSGCSKHDISKILKNSIGESFNTTINYCFKKGDIYFWTATRIVIVSVFVLFGTIVVISTWIDNNSEKWKNNKLEFKSRILQVFSLTRNFSQLMNTDVPKNSITCLNGIRVLTIFWIILGHEYIFHLFLAIGNHFTTNYPIALKSFLPQMFLNAYITVDIFLFISGFVNCYTKSIAKEEGRPQAGILKAITHRLWRIYPAYIIMFLVYGLLNKPQPYAYNFQVEEGKKCEQYWWRSILFINNFFSPLEMCMPHSWYLSTDMQLFLVTFFTIPVLLSKPKRGVILHISLILIVNLCSMSYWFLLDDVPAASVDGSRLERSAMEKSYYMYTLPFVHVGSYFIGILLGYAIATKREIKIPKVTQLLGWLIASFFFVSMLFMALRWNSGFQSTQLENSLYGAWSRTVAILGFSWLVFCCTTGHARLINYILSLKLWAPLSRITYMVYLISPLIQGHDYSHFNFPKDFSEMSIIWNYFANLSISLLLSFSLVLIYESPLLALENVLLRKKQTEQKIPPQVQNELTSSDVKENGKIVTVHL